ncbi:MAG: hypothetical protein EA398_15620, partial [Deltaproteobacteria bacterium]
GVVPGTVVRGEGGGVLSPLGAGGAGAPPGELAPAYRLLRPPRPVGVRTDGAGRPQEVHLGGRWCRVREVGGPWPVSGGWWDEARVRIYWDTRVDGGGWLRLFVVPWPAGWFHEGWWD